MIEQEYEEYEEQQKILYTDVSVNDCNSEGGVLSECEFKKMLWNKAFWMPYPQLFFQVERDKYRMSVLLMMQSRFPLIQWSPTGNQSNS